MTDSRTLYATLPGVTEPWDSVFASRSAFTVADSTSTLRTSRLAHDSSHTIPGRPPLVVDTPAKSKDLLQLALSTGNLSRFLLDPRFNRHFKALRDTSIRKSLLEHVSKVITLCDSRHMLGMVSLSAKEGTGTIGLIVIDEDRRAHGPTMRPLKQCASQQRGVTPRTRAAVTQKADIGGCPLHQKAGDAVSTERDIRHIGKG